MAGEKIFGKIGCAVCHNPSFTTEPAGTDIKNLVGERGSDIEKIPAALGGMTFHPYSDFLLHDIGTGDGIAQTQHADFPPKGSEDTKSLPPEILKEKKLTRVKATPERGERRVVEAEQEIDQRTANMIRTAPLWGLRTRPELMHDGLALTIDEAIRRHKGQAEAPELYYERLSADERRQLLAFLMSL